MLVLSVPGGLALFLFGIHILSDSLIETAGGFLRRAFGRMAQHRLAGCALGAGLGTFVHSNTVTVMLVGFVNAGVLTLADAVPTVFGANLGTTLSIQIISFDLDRFCYLLLVVGVLLSLVSRRRSVQRLGNAIAGFGLLFLGIRTIAVAVRPFRAEFAAFLQQVHGTGLTAVFSGLAISWLLTALIQSSAATVGLCFALLSAGAMTSLAQVYPFLLGAHIGACTTALLGSIGANIEARRTAVAHLLFNVLSASLGLAAAPFFLWLAPFTASDIVHQTANLNMLVQLGACAIFLPAVPVFVRLVRWVTPSRQPPPETSYLDLQVLDRPEQAICAAIRELNRVARVCDRSLHLTVELLLQFAPRRVTAIKRNEMAIDEIKSAMKAYLAAITARQLSRRQAILIMHLDRCMIDIERIGDHVDAMCDLTTRRRRLPAAQFNRELLELLFVLYEKAHAVLHVVAQSLDPGNPNFQIMAEAILKARDEYVRESFTVKVKLMERLDRKEIPPLAGLYFGEYIAAMDRVVKHSKSIALAELHAEFWIKRQKLDRVADEAPAFGRPPPVEARDFLDRLQSEDYP